jgi:hypothetical protein
MGLDQFAYRIKSKPETEVDFEIQEEESEMIQIHYWRKHSNLQGWMEELYREKGGKETFNCVNLQLREEDILNLERDIKERKLPRTGGFFFGASSEDGSEEIEDDLNFVNEAKEALTEGDCIVYSSWW